MPKLITSVKNWNWINRKEETSSERNKYRKHGITGSSGHSKKQATLSYRIKRNKACYMMLAPYFILFFFFTVLPVVMSVAFSFTYYNMLEMPEFIGWKNYIKLFLEDDIF